MKTILLPVLLVACAVSAQSQIVPRMAPVPGLQSIIVLAERADGSPGLDTVSVERFDRQGGQTYLREKRYMNSERFWDAFGNEVLYREFRSGGTTFRKTDAQGRVLYEVNYLLLPTGKRQLFDSTAYAYLPDGKSRKKTHFSTLTGPFRKEPVEDEMLLAGVGVGPSSAWQPKGTLAEFDSAHRLIRFRYPNRNEWKYSYDASGRMTERHFLEYRNRDGRLAFASDPLGKSFQLQLCGAEQSDVLEHFWRFTYNAEGKRILEDYSVGGQAVFSLSCTFRNGILIDSLAIYGCADQMQGIEGFDYAFRSLVYKYYPDQRKKVYKYFDTQSKLVFGKILLLDEKGRVIEETAYDGEQEKLWAGMYRYDSQGLRTSANEFDFKTGNVLKMTYQYTYW